MNTTALVAVKLQTADLGACEEFFAAVFGFETTLRYGGGPDDDFEEVVMTRGGGMMLKFIQQRNEPKSARGATIQIRLASVDAAVKAATAANAIVAMAATDFADAGVRMAVVTTDQGLHIELVESL